MIFWRRKFFFPWFNFKSFVFLRCFQSQYFEGFIDFIHYFITKLDHKLMFWVFPIFKFRNLNLTSFQVALRSFQPSTFIFASYFCDFLSTVNWIYFWSYVKCECDLIPEQSWTTFFHTILHSLEFCSPLHLSTCLYSCFYPDGSAIFIDNAWGTWIHDSQSQRREL